MTSEEKPAVRSADMSVAMQAVALEVGAEAVAKYTVEREIAAHIKKDFDRRYGPTWHCIVGRNYGSFVTHIQNNFIYYYIDKLAILLFKAG
ncbi:unnamed protein product [Medioppia subpectinata]|uniref:Dynein light chain n=1 Tax=Medioppia subpectinata TaxID=1979941 RepID=A0A7R9L2I7_9ACAR|nr:unnamed protein product [Medioppia subpectinata]CAG2114208.1 unnamed protein product [Medioppia subpectinata]